MDQSAVLYNAARHLVQVLVNVPSYCALPCIRRFLGPHGHFYFDEVTKTTTVQQLLLKLDISSLESYLDFLFTSFIRVEGIESLTGEKNSRLVASKAFLSRRSTIKKMRGLLSLPLTVQKEVIIGKVVKFLSLYGNFTVNGKEPSLETLFPSETYVAAPIPPLCSETRFLCQSLAAYIFSNVSAWLHRPSKRNTKQKSTAGSFEHFSELLLVEHFRFNKQLFLLSLRRHSAVASLLDDQFATLFQSALELEHKLFVRQSLDSALSKRFRGLYLLLLHCGVLMLQEPHEYAGIVSDLLKCNEKFTTEDDAAGPGAAGVVVDIILSLLARPAVCIRPLCLEVFCCISPFLDGESLLHVVEVLEVDEKTFVNSRLQTSDIEQEESEEDNLCYERGVEEVDTVREHSQETAQEEMPDLTDEQMAQFDGALSLIFKQRKEIQQRKKETAALYAHLQLRVVELLNVYLQAQPTNPLLLRLIAPLLVGFRMCTKKTTGQANHLASLILLLLKKLFRSKKEALIMMAKGASEEIVSTLKRVVTLFDKTSEARVTGPSLEAIRFLLDLAKEHSQWPAKFATDLTVLYGVALKDFAGKRSTLYNSKFFEQYISQCPEFSVSFLYSCVDSLKISRNNYSSVRILEFIRALLNKKSKLKRSLVENGISSHCASLLGGLTDFISSFTSNFFPESKPPQKKYQANLKYFSLYLNHLLSILQHLKNLKAFESCKDIIIERLMTKIQFISDSYFCRDKPNVSTLCRQIKTILCDVSCVKRANVHSASGKRKKLTTDINTQLALAKRKLSN
ncbi:uncharacterized protein LOC135145899 [Zophobas morio]|uniref:uncharacterized protein LOC135145899 n=1 Tax=Zophobas morio TaxID=2755281 RepID=UPI003082A57D